MAIICKTTGALLSLAVVLTSVAAAAQKAPDAERGRTLAARLCSNCHETGREPAQNAKVEPPSFRAIAARHHSPEVIAGKIIVPHPEMPQVPLTVGEIRDIVAYIQSLGGN